MVVRMNHFPSTLTSRCLVNIKRLWVQTMFSMRGRHTNLTVNRIDTAADLKLEALDIQEKFRKYFDALRELIIPTTIIRFEQE